ncbi:MAG: hypothetical protein QGG36_27445 [Pirellulaceae bacterium]|jgi:hypothetical protein|nr:hypothetical protein [Pirellulaceae bacterium]MDP7019562.1 hypothetical protein [Pirellulaceae bacterium]
MSTLMAGSREEALAVFRRHWTYLSGPNAASSLWRKLTHDEKRTLGGSLAAALTRHRRLTSIWMHLHPRISEPRAVVELAVRLFSYPVDEADWLLREMGELPIDQEAAKAEAIARGDLVLVRRDRAVYWEGADLEVNWGNGKVLWEFLLLACEHTQHGEDINRLSIGDHAGDRVVAQRIYRLRQVSGLPQTLTDQFDPVGLGTQRFNCPASRIHIFDD